MNGEQKSLEVTVLMELINGAKQIIITLITTKVNGKFLPASAGTQKCMQYEGQIGRSDSVEKSSRQLLCGRDVRLRLDV